MSLDYASIALDVDAILAETGQPVTIRTVTTGAYDPSTGKPSTTSSDLPGTGAVFDFSLHLSGTAFLPGTLILAGDKQLLLSPVGMTEPQPGSFVIIGTKTWHVVATKTLAPAGIPVLYEVLLRK